LPPTFGGECGGGQEKDSGSLAQIRGEGKKKKKTRRKTFTPGRVYRRSPKREDETNQET